MENKKRNKKSGFTLIELVVVIAIIGVLAAVVTPRIRISLAKAKDTSAVAALDALRTASNVYYAEKGVPVFEDTDDFENGLGKLVDNGYLDSKSEAKFEAGEIEVGSLNTTNCPNPTLDTGKRIGFTVDADLIGISFDANTLDANCKPWDEK